MERAAARRQHHQTLVERQICEAQKAGVFDHLEGEGRPFTGLDQPYDPLWWAKDKLRREGLSVLPASLELRRTVEGRVERILGLDQEDRVRAAMAELDREIRRANATSIAGPSTDLYGLDSERIVEQWRATRAAASD